MQTDLRVTKFREGEIHQTYTRSKFEPKFEPKSLNG